MSFTDEEMNHLHKVKAHIELYLYKFWPWLADSTAANYVVAGGMIARMVQGVHYLNFNDMDVFTLNQNFIQFAPRLIPFAKKRDKPDVGYINDRISGVYDIPKTNNPFEGNLGEINVQIIETSYKTREEVIGEFDYVHCTMHYWNKKLYATPAAYRAAKNKRLVFTAYGEVVNRKNLNMKRYEKFINRGYHPIQNSTVNPWKQVASGIVSGINPFILPLDSTTT